jgi:hypothetical protein
VNNDQRYRAVWEKCVVLVQFCFELIIIKVDNEPTLLERIRGTVKATRRLAYENFTQNLFSVPGYTSREAKDPADRPFEPSPG